MSSPPATRPKPGLIDIKLRRAGQPFNSFDPSPFPGRDLDDKAEEFIVGWAREVREIGCRIVIHLPPEECETPIAKSLPEAVARHFEYRTGVLTRELRELFRTGRLFLAIGLSIFVFCNALAQATRAIFPLNAVTESIEQGLIIVGWVANWRPVELLIFDWWPLRRRIRLYEQLAQAEIVVNSEGQSR